VKVPDRRSAAVGFIVCLGLTTWACGSRRTPPANVPVVPRATGPEELPGSPVSIPVAPSSGITDPDCLVIDEPGELVSTVALSERIDRSNAPAPSNDSERLLFRQLYETLIRVDCGGQARPGLAARWRLDADGRTWILTLREHAQFSDGTAVTPRDVRASWTDGPGDELRSTVSHLIESIVPLDERSMAITLRSPRVDVPLALAHANLAVAKHTADGHWPLGTRVDSAAAESVAPGGGPDSAIVVKRYAHPPIRFLVPSGDPRDLLDSSIDLMITRDPAALDYAATLPDFASVPLEWHRTHLLLAPGRTRASPALSAAARQMLADDAVRGEARGASGPFWWQEGPDCVLAPARTRPAFGSMSRIVYDAGDAVARDLAERLVGLARDSGPSSAAILDALLPDRPRHTFARAVGLSGGLLAEALHRGGDAGYIVSVDRRPLDPCRDMQVLMAAASWLQPETIVPLTEIRLRAIVRRGRSGITADWDGGLLLGDRSVRYR
jgi:hypothetical protein